MKYIIFIVSVFFINSIWSETQINYKNQQTTLINDSENISTLNIHLNKIKNKKQFLKEWFLKNYLKSVEEVSIKEIQNNKYSIIIYQINLSNKSQTSLNKKYSIIHYKKLNMSFIVPFEFNMMFQSYNKIMIGGYKESREYEFYNVYTLKNKTLKLVMDTSKDCDYGIKVGYFRNDECLEYAPNRFDCNVKFKNKIEFVGKIKNYCKPKFDRNENDLHPLSIINTKIIYKYSNTKNKWIYQKQSNYKCW